MRTRSAIAVAVAVMAATAWGGVCEKERDWMSGALCIITNATAYASTTTITGSSLSTWAVWNPEVLDAESRTNCVNYWATSGVLWPILGGDTGIVCTVTSEVATDTTETDNGISSWYWICTTRVKDQAANACPPTEKTEATIVTKTTTLRFRWQGETWTATHTEELSRVERVYRKEETWVEVPK